MTNFLLKLNEGIKRFLNPFEIEKNVAETIGRGGAPRRISGLGRKSFLIEVTRETENDKIRNKTTLLGQSCTVDIHRFHNEKKGIIYPYNTPIVDLCSFRIRLH